MSERLVAFALASETALSSAERTFVRPGIDPTPLSSPSPFYYFVAGALYAVRNACILHTASADAHVGTLNSLSHCSTACTRRLQVITWANFLSSRVDSILLNLHDDPNSSYSQAKLLNWDKFGAEVHIPKCYAYSQTNLYSRCLLVTMISRSTLYKYFTYNSH